MRDANITLRRYAQVQAATARRAAAQMPALTAGVQVAASAETEGNTLPPIPDFPPSHARNSAGVSESKQRTCANNEICLGNGDNFRLETSNALSDNALTATKDASGSIKTGGFPVNLPLHPGFTFGEPE